MVIDFVLAFICFSNFALIWCIFVSCLFLI